MKIPTSFSKALDISENTAWCMVLSEFLLVCRVLKLDEHDGESSVSAVAAAFASASSAFAPAFASARLASAVATAAATSLTSGFATARVLENIFLL